MKKITTLLYLFLHFAVCYAQSPLETAPASIKWSQINTEHFNVLFPSDFEREGTRMAYTLEHLYGPVSSSMEITPRKINILLQNRNSIANGFVALAPRRSEFFTMSPQGYNFLGTNDWLNLLALHEFRHVAQVDKSLTGFNKFVYWILGEYAFSGMGAAAVPSWFKEGDAVSIETALSNSGRGRIPAFNMVMRTTFLERGHYTFNKQYLTSFKDFVPNQYVLGYFMNDYLRNQYDENPWSDIVLNASRKAIVPFTFSNSIKKVHGKYLVPTYEDMAEDITSKWQEQQERILPTDFEKNVNRKNQTFTNYLYPQLMANGEVIALKSGLSDIQTFIRVNEKGVEKKLFRPGVFNDAGFLSVGTELLAWTEYAFDPRWGKRSYSVVKTINIRTKEAATITRKSRYSGAAVSPDDSKIAVVNNLIDGRTHIRVLDARTGNVLREPGTADYEFISMLRWSEDGRKIVGLRHRTNTKAIALFDMDSNEEVILKDYSSENVGHPVLSGPYLYYNSPYSGIDNIYAINLETQEIYQVTSSRYGAFNPSVSEDGRTMVYNEFTSQGMDIVRVAIDPGSWRPIGEVPVDVVNYYSKTVAQEDNAEVLADIPKKEYVAHPYKRGSKLLNIHSWGPYFGTSALDWDIGVVFQDVLSQNSGFAGYRYNVDENTGKWTLDYSYEGFYPALDFEAYTGTRKALQNLGDSVNITYDWKEKGVAAGVRFPWNVTRSKYISRIELSNDVGYNRVTDFSNTINDDRYSISLQANGDLLLNNFEFNYRHLLKRAKRDIQSKWGQVVLFDWVSTPYGGDYDGGLGSITTYLYFPGIGRHHSLNFLGAYQGRKITLDADNYLFSNRVPYPRGYQSSSWQKFYTLRTNYDFTLWNADLALGPVLNIQRVRAKVFYDTGYGETDVTNSNLQVRNSFNYNSYGSEVWFDFNVMRLLPLLSAGIRSVYVPDSGWNFEIVFGNIQI